MSTITKNISIFTLIMFITGAIDNIRNLPTSALFGNSLIFFFIISAITFLIPAALISAELTSTWTEKSGIYHWSYLAFGEKIGLLAIWLQWINTMVWFPTVLSFLAGTISYLIYPELAQNRIYLISVILITFWAVTLISLKGLRLSALFASACAIIGMLIPMLLIIGLTLIWIGLGKPLQIHLSFDTLIPSLSQTNNWISLTAIMTAFLGMELATVHVREIKNPQHNFPRALLWSVFIILFTMTMGALGLAFVLPAKQINLVNGVMQAFTNFFTVFHMPWMIPVIAVMLIIGTVGALTNWLISPAKGLLQAAQLGYLPKLFTKTNKHGVAHNLLILQAVLVSLICLAFLLMPSVNGSYWLLTALSTQLYMLMYVIMFCAGIVLRYRFPSIARPFRVGNNMTMWLVGLLGLIGCGITLLIGFFPPDGINFGGLLHYEIVFCLGIVVMILPVGFLYAFKHANYDKIKVFFNY